MKTNKIIHAQYSEDYKIKVQFKNGLEGIFDMKPYLEIGVFKKLQNQAFFKSMRVNYGTLTWPEEIDIAPDTVEFEILQNQHISQ